MPLRVTFTLADDDIRHLRARVKQARKAADEAGETAVLRSAKRLVKKLQGPGGLPSFVAEKLSSLETLIAMVEDQRWAAPQRVRERVLDALAYFTDPADLIPDDIPGLGFLDDAILIELVCRDLRHEIEAYRDFQSFGRVDKEGRRGDTTEESEFRERRERLRRRARRRTRRDREGASGRGTRVSLW